MKRICAYAFVLFVGGWALATPSNQAILDGRPIEYDQTDLRSSFAGSSAWGGNNVITNLYLTWDTNYLYVALQGWEDNNKLAVLLDVDPTNGTGASTTTNWTGVVPDFIRYNDVGWQAADTNTGALPFGLDYMISSEGYYNNFLRVLYNGAQIPDSNTVIALFDKGNGATPQGSPVDMAVKADGTACQLKGIEARIPWSALYDTNLNRFGTVEVGEIVPRGATLRVFANLHNNDPAICWSSSDTVPVQTGPNAYYTNGIVTGDTYADVIVDGNNDGIPDVSGTDLNAPFLRHVAGLAGKRSVYALFNEPLDAASAMDISHWQVEAATPASVEMVATNAVMLHLTNDLPAEGTIARVAATNVSDALANARLTYLCLFPTASGIETSVTVRFVLEKNSGMGVLPGVSNVFINGSALPLEWGYPPATVTPLSLLDGTLYYVDITFPPTTPQRLEYKYSGQLSSGTGKGINNYEAICLMDYANAARLLTLNTDGVSMVVTDYLGAAAGPWRDPSNPTNYNNLYNDTHRNDAGVRQRAEVLFQVDLSKRDLRGVDRVLLLGSDPLRGFNTNGEPARVSDNPGTVGMTWLNAGLSMVDDGTLGDLVAGDAIYSRMWYFSPDGFDAVAEPGIPNALVGGNEYTEPYLGDYSAGGRWRNQRSPRRFTYRFAVHRVSGDALLSPTGANLDRYLAADMTNLVFPAYVWDNGDLPLPPASNSPTMSGVDFTGGVTLLVFSNAPSELQHGVQISTNLLSPWLDYGQRATTNTAGQWVAVIPDAGGMETYRALAGSGRPYSSPWWVPSLLPQTGGTLRIYFDQNSTALAGDRAVQIAGTFSGWGPAPMTFVGDGLWYYDALIESNAADRIEFKYRNAATNGTIWIGEGGGTGGGDIFAYKGILRASWAPDALIPGSPFTFTYDAAGGPLAAATNVNAHYGYDGWLEANPHPMTNTAGTVWELTFDASTNYSHCINVVFNGGVPPSGTTVWDNQDSGRKWRAFYVRP